MDDQNDAILFTDECRNRGTSRCKDRKTHKYFITYLKGDDSETNFDDSDHQRHLARFDAFITLKSAREAQQALMPITNLSNHHAAPQPEERRDQQQQRIAAQRVE